MRKKIKQHFAKNYASSPCDVSDQEIDFIIEQDCECECGKSIFELYDFPEINIEENELLCEDCYHDRYYEYCPVCEEAGHKDDFISDYFFISKEISKTTKQPPGLYKILERPFYCGDFISGFDDFYDGAIEKVSDMDIQEVGEARGVCKDNVKLDCICQSCVEKYTRKDNFINAEHRYSILMESQRYSFFADYSDETIHRYRQELIHSNINFRGILEKYNCTKK